VDVNTTRRMASLIYSYIGGDTRELVHRTRTAQRHYKMDGVTKTVVINFSFENENPMIDSTLKLIQGMIFFKEPKV